MHTPAEGMPAARPVGTVKKKYKHLMLEDEGIFVFLFLLFFCIFSLVPFFDQIDVGDHCSIQILLTSWPILIPRQLLRNAVMALGLRQQDFWQKKPSRKKTARGQNNKPSLIIGGLDFFLPAGP